MSPLPKPIPKAYQLKISLADSEPEIWRQVVVPTQITLEDLHRIIQLAMGWENLHTYAFDVGLAEKRSRLSNTQSLAEVITPAAPLYYTYDFDSGWLHRITLDSLEATTTEESEQSQSLPTCTDGAGACPPEGTGGVWGYDNFLDRLEDSEDPNYMDMIDKYGDFDPLAFSLAEANRRLA